MIILHLALLYLCVIGCRHVGLGLGKSVILEIEVVHIRFGLGFRLVSGFGLVSGLSVLIVVEVDIGLGLGAGFSVFTVIEVYIWFGS